MNLKFICFWRCSLLVAWPWLPVLVKISVVLFRFLLVFPSLHVFCAVDCYMPFSQGSQRCLVCAAPRLLLWRLMDFSYSDAAAAPICRVKTLLGFRGGFEMRHCCRCLLIALEIPCLEGVDTPSWRSPSLINVCLTALKIVFWLALLSEGGALTACLQTMGWITVRSLLVIITSSWPLLCKTWVALLCPRRLLLSHITLKAAIASVLVYVFF